MISSYRGHGLDKYHRGPTFSRETTIDFLCKVEGMVEEDTKEVLVQSPYGDPGLDAILSHETTRELLQRGFEDRWGRHWRLLNFDSGAKPFVLKFRPVSTFTNSLRRSFQRIARPHKI